MQYLETTADAACEILKDKFQYVSDQLELNSKQGCGVGSPVIRLRLRLRAIAIIRLRLQLRLRLRADSDLQLY